MSRLILIAHIEYKKVRNFNFVSSKLGYALSQCQCCCCCCQESMTGRQNIRCQSSTTKLRLSLNIHQRDDQSAASVAPWRQRSDTCARANICSKRRAKHFVTLGTCVRTFWASFQRQRTHGITEKSSRTIPGFNLRLIWPVASDFIAVRLV